MKKPQFALVVASYNNAKWCHKNLSSIASQNYPNYRLYYINDTSTDETAALAKQFIESSPLKDKTTFIDNRERKGSLRNFYETIHTIDPHAIIVCIDGDDWLAHEHVLERLAEEYSGGEIWLTYGDFEREPPNIIEGRCEEIPEEVKKTNSIRTYSFVAHHLKTFYAGLFQKIEMKDLMIDDQFFPMTGDVAFMTPMLEMASQNHFRYIPDVLYIYNIANPLNDFKREVELQKQYMWIIRVKEPYSPLEKLF